MAQCSFQDELNAVIDQAKRVIFQQ